MVLFIFLVGMTFCGIVANYNYPDRDPDDDYRDRV